MALQFNKKDISSSMKLNKLFCWPCLLFRHANDKGVWSKTGYNDLNHLTTMKTHAASKDHINNAIALSTYGQQRIDEALDHGRQVARNRHNAEVTKNRNGMKTLIEVTCLLASRIGLFALMLMAVVGELLKEISENFKFYELVIDAFARKSQRRIPLLFK